MTLRKYAAGFLSASLFVATVALAATPNPPDDPAPKPVPVPVPAPAPAPVVTPTLLWVYGDPNAQWLIMDYFPLEDTCLKSLATLKVTPPQAAECFPVGVDPDRLHHLYGSEASMAPSDEGGGD